MAEPEPKQCRSLVDSTSKLVVLAFDLAGAEVNRAPARIVEALRSKAVQDAIRKALETEANRLLNDQGTGATPEGKNGADLAKNLGQAAWKAITGDVRRQIEESPGMRQLTTEAKAVLNDFECSPVGVWVNEHRTLLIVVGAVLALGSGVAMYFAQAGDPVAQFAEGQGSSFKLGSLEFSAKLTEFKPSTQTVGVSLGVKANWKPLQVEFKVAGKAVGADGSVSVDGKVIVPLAPRLQAVAYGRIDLASMSNSPETRHLTLAGPAGLAFGYRAYAGLELKDNGFTLGLLAMVDNHRLGGSLAASYQGRLGGVPIRGSLFGQVGPAPPRFSGANTLAPATGGGAWPWPPAGGGPAPPPVGYGVFGNLAVEF